MTHDLYRVNFAHQGRQHSLLKTLIPPPSVGDHLQVERFELVVTAIRPSPNGPSMIHAVVEDRTGTS